jgi:hypothetical protein
MVIVLGGFAGGVYVTVHVPDASVHVDELNVPPKFPSLQIIVPVGIFWESAGSATVAVNVTAVPDTYVAGFGDTVTNEVVE